MPSEAAHRLHEWVPEPSAKLAESMRTETAMANDNENNNGDSGKVNPIQVQKFLCGMDYPADKQALVDTAREQGADERVMNALEQLPDGNYETPADVSKGIRQVNNS